jgi:hypothetical protein
VPLVPRLFSKGGVAVTGYTMSGRHSRTLRDVVDYSRVMDPQLPLSWELLESLRTLLGCDHIMIEGCDYGQQALYFSQRIWAGETSFVHEVDKVEKARFWQLVLRSPNVEPFIPARNESLVSDLPISDRYAIGAICLCTPSICGKVRERRTSCSCRSQTATGDNCVSSGFESRVAISTSESASISNC